MSRDVLPGVKRINRNDYIMNSTIQEAAAVFPSSFWTTLYDLPKGYHDVGRLRRFIAESVNLAVVMNPQIRDDVETWRRMPANEQLGIISTTCVGITVAHNGFPFYVLTRPLVEMILHTDLPDDVSLTGDARPPFDGGSLLMPTGIRSELFHGEEVISVSWAFNPFGIDHGAFAVVVVTNNADAKETAHFAHVELDAGGRVITRGNNFPPALRFLALLFLALNCVDEDLVIGETLVKQVKATKKGMPKRNVCRPAFIGLSLRPTGFATAITGCGKQRWHIRRGHMRNVRCGEGRTERRRVWIKPYQVNVPVEEGVAP